MTKKERKVLKATVKTWNRFMALPVQHNDDQNEFRFHIHALQNMIFARPTIRKQKK